MVSGQGLDNAGQMSTKIAKELCTLLEKTKWEKFVRFSFLVHAPSCEAYIIMHLAFNFFFQESTIKS